MTCHRPVITGHRPDHQRSSAGHQRRGDISSTVGHNRSPTGRYWSSDRSPTGMRASDAELSSEDSTDATWMSIREGRKESNEENVLIANRRLLVSIQVTSIVSSTSRSLTYRSKLKEVAGEFIRRNADVFRA